jgi:ankyrin repeat protein
MTTAWRNAISSNNVEEVQTLINEGEDVNDASDDTFNPLSYAIHVSIMIRSRYGFDTPCPLPVIKLLLDSNADAESPHGIYEITPIVAAATAGAVEIVELLIAYGVDVFRVDCYNKTVFEMLDDMCQIPLGPHTQRLQVKTIIKNEMDKVWRPYPS